MKPIAALLVLALRVWPATFVRVMLARGALGKAGTAIGIGFVAGAI